MVNGVFGKILNLASETVILELIKSKCMPIFSARCNTYIWPLLGPLVLHVYGIECFNLSKAELHSLDFTINRLFVKLFKTSNISVVKECQYFLY